MSLLLCFIKMLHSYIYIANLNLTSKQKSGKTVIILNPHLSLVKEKAAAVVALSSE